MTKIKNTKKGMAKKTLSISLAVAMLATSNVPVWAAEFTDGTDAAFTSEVEAPVEVIDEAPIVDEETVVDAQSKDDVFTAKDLDLSKLTVKVNESTTDADGQDIIYGSQIKVGGEIQKTHNGVTDKLNIFSYGYRIKGHTEALVTEKIEDGNVSKMNAYIHNESGVDWSSALGQDVELYIFKDDEWGKFSDVVLATFKVVPKEVSGSVVLTLDKQEADANKAGNFWVDAKGNYKVAYSGKKVAYKTQAASDDKVLEIKELKRKDGSTISGEALNLYDVTVIGNPVLNVGEEMVVRATPKADSGLTGEFLTTVSIRPLQGDFKAKTFLTAELNADLTYEYTGKDISIPVDKITVKEKAGKYADAVIPQDAIETAVLKKGADIVTVTLDPKKVVNFDISQDAKLTTTDKVTVNKRDLTAEHTNISIKYGKLPEKWGADWVHSRLQFKGTEAGNPDLSLVVNEDYKVTVYNDKGDVVTGPMTGGTYTAVIAALKDSVNTTGSQKITFQVGEDVFAGVRYMNNYKPEYTGSEIKPTKEDLGELEITESVPGPIHEEKFIVSTKDYDIVSYDKNINASTYDDAGTPLTYGEVTVKVHDDAPNYPGKSFTLLFEILPLSVSAETITVPSTVSYNKEYTKANEYKVPLIVTATNKTGKTVKGLSEKDYTVTYKYDNEELGNTIGNKVWAEVTVVNPNFKGVPVEGQNPAQDFVVTYDDFKKAEKDHVTKATKIVAKALTNDMVHVNPSSYTYTGKAIVPNYYVMDGPNVLYDVERYGVEKGEYRFVRCESNLNVGTGKVVVEGVEDKYSGTASATFEITPANTKDVKVEIADQIYTGETIRPRTSDIKVTLNGVDVTSQFEVVTDAYGKNVSGKGTVTLRPTTKTKNFTGANVVGEFNIVKEIVSGKLAAYNSNGENVTTAYDVMETDLEATAKYEGSAFDFDGTEKTFAKVLLKDLTKEGTGAFPGLGGTMATADDFEIKYADNIAGAHTDMVDKDGNHYNIAYVYAVGKEGSGYAGKDTITLADGSKITGVVAKMTFAIKNVKFVDKNVTVTNGEYAGGLQVKPNVIVQIGGHTLLEGKDYTLVLTGDKEDNHYVNATVDKVFDVEVKGKGGYAGSLTSKFAWGIDKKDLKNCDVKVVNGVAYVMNGYIPVPTTEYTVKDNGDKTYTVTANATSKNYTGSKTVVAEGQKPTDKPETPMIEKVNVVGNKATVILSGETEGAVGYDYVISTDKDCINNKDYDKVNKNILNTTTDFTYVGQDVYYAYCHAWKRGEDGKKIFSDWSNAYPFVVSAITPSQPAITSVKVKGSTVTVTYTKSSNADGYDVVLGSKVATVAGEKRPVEYGTLVKKNIKGNTVTATFKNVKKGTYYVGLHAFNRTSEDGKKVFSPWSNVKKATT